MDKVAVLVPIINKVAKYQNPGKKTLQKLVYLIQRKGVNLGFDYSIHYYGPYSSRLDYAIHSLESQGAIEIIQDGITHRIRATDIYETLVDGNEVRQLSEGQTQIIDDVLGRYSMLSAKQLELITTTDYVATQLCGGGKSYDNASIVTGVKTIKGDKFSEDEVVKVIAQLREQGFLMN